MTAERKSGFTLLEVLITTAILVAVTWIVNGYYRNFAKSRELDIAAKSVSFSLRSSQSRAIAGEDLKKWGIHFVNGVAAFDDYYEIFSTPTTYADVATVVDQTVYLPSSVAFSDPATNSVKDIIFDRIKGSISVSTTVSIISEGATKVITVNAQGNIY